MKSVFSFRSFLCRFLTLGALAGFLPTAALAENAQETQTSQAVSPANVSAEPPVILWASTPVQRGETALVFGGNFTPDAKAVVTWNEHSEIVEPISVSENCVMFEMPGWECDVAIRCAAGESKKVSLNRPEIWWVQGDQGRSASVGGWIFVQTNQVPGGKVLLEVRRKGEKGSFSIQNGRRNRIREDEKPGGYEIWCKNQKFGEFRIEPKSEIFKPERFDVTDFGAVPNDGIDDSPAFLAALEKIRENGGGILFVPVGRFMMRETIELPPHSALSGPALSEGARSRMAYGKESAPGRPEGTISSGAQIFWPDASEPLEALVHGSHDFVVQNIFLTCGNHRDGISNQPLTAEKQKAAEKLAAGEVPEPAKPQKNVRIQNVTLRMLYSEFVNDTLEEMTRRLKPIHYVRALRLSGENVTVTENDVYCAAGGVFELKCRWSAIFGNRFCRGNVIGWNGFGGQQLLFTENHLGGANCTSFYGLPEGSENIRWANNTHEMNFDGNNRETVTGDLRIHGYFDRVEQITPTGFNLKKEIQGEKGETLTGSAVLARGIETWFKPENELQQNGAVQLAAGKGVGQIRRIREISTLEDGTIHVEVDRPWEILPDEETVAVISSFRLHFVYENNESYDSTVALQFYGSLLESLIIGNQTARTGGFNGDSMSGEPGWFNQFIENRIQDGNSYRGPRNETPATDAQLGILNYGNGIKNYRYPLIRACVVRRNELQFNAKINVMGNVSDALIERNQILDSDAGILVDPAARGILLSANRFQRVKRPFTVSPESVILDSAEALARNLEACGLEVPWLPVTPKLTSPKAPKTPEELAAIRTQTIAKFAEDRRTANRPITAEEVELLTGLQISFPNWATADALLKDGQAGSAPLYLRAANSQVAATLRFEVRPEDFPRDGWSFEFPEFVLKPGEAVAQNLKLTKPAGAARLLRLPLTAELVGDGWTLRFPLTASDPWGELPLTDWLLSAPLPNPAPQTQPAGIGYLSYEKLPKPASETLTPQVAQNGRLNLTPPATSASASESSSPESADGSVFYASATLEAHDAAQIRLQNWSRNALVFVNGKLIGTNQNRGQWGFADLNPGSNLIEVWVYASKRNSFQFTVPRITWASDPFAITD